MFKVSIQKTALIPPSDETFPDIHMLYDKALKTRPDLLDAVRQVNVDQDQITLLKAQRIPDPTITPAYGYLSFDPKNAPATEQGTTFLSGVSLQVSFTTPIFHNQGPELKQARATLDQSQLQVTQTVRQLQSDIRTAYLAAELDKVNILEYQKK